MAATESATAVFDDEDIGGIVEEVFASMLDMPVTRGAGPGDGDGQPVPHLTSLVHITGAWTGAVTVDCTVALGRAVAASMFDADPGDLEPDEVHDAVGELANMIGGNVKNLVPGESRLSIPSVTEGVQYRIAVPRSVTRNRLDFVVGLDTDPGIGEERLRVSVLEQAAG